MAPLRRRPPSNPHQQNPNQPDGSRTAGQREEITQPPKHSALYALCNSRPPAKPAHERRSRSADLQIGCRVGVLAHAHQSDQGKFLLGPDFSLTEEPTKSLGLHKLRKNSHQAQLAGALYQGMALAVPIEPIKRSGLQPLRKYSFPSVFVALL